MPKEKPKADDRRSQLIQLIHVGKRDLGLDEDTYRHLLTETTQKDSTKKMTIPQLNRVLDAMKQLGFKVRNKGGRPQAKDAMSKKIRALWLELHNGGHVENPSEEALATYVMRITKVEALQWLDGQQAAKVIETLKQWLKRVQSPALEQPQ